MTPRRVLLTLLALVLPVLAVVPGVGAPAASAPSAAKVTLLAPQSGTVTSSPDQPHHTPFGGDYAFDISGGSDVYARFRSSTGDLTLSVNHIRWACGSRQFADGGNKIVLNVEIDGVLVGHVTYAHLTDFPITSGDVPVGARIGRVVTRDDGVVKSGCWTGPHVHVEANNITGFGCYFPGQRTDPVTLDSALGIVGGSPASGINQRCSAKQEFEGTIIRRTGGVSWVVLGGIRYHLRTFATDVCAQYHHRYPVISGLSAAQASSIPESGTPYDCSLNGLILNAADGPDPKPSFLFRNGQKWSIPDAQTWKYWKDGKGAPVVRLPLSVVNDSRLSYGGVERRRLYAPDWEGKIIRRADGISWVVLGGQRHHLPTYAIDVCTQYAQRREARGGFVDSQTGSIPEGSAHACNLNGHILRASNQPDPKPSFVYHDNKRYWLRDPWTYDYYVRRQFGVVHMPHAAITDDRLADGGTEAPKLDPQSIPIRTIIRRNDGVSWVVDGNRVRHHIPFRQDDVCWRNLGGRGVGPTPVSATNLTYDQARQLPEGDAWPCIIGDRVVRSDDGSSWFVDQTNTRHWIPDTDTFGALSRRHPVVGPWPAGDVNQVPKGSDMPRMLDPEAVKNTIVCRTDNVCWAVDGSGVRHHIPTHADNVCWRWVNGWHVSRNGVSDEQARSLPEGDAWGCNMNGYIIATNERPAYYMEGNTRRWIPDGYDFECLQRGRTVIRGMSLAEASGIPEGNAMPVQECAGIDIVTIRSAYSGQYVTTEIGYGGNDYAMVRAARGSVGSDWERFRLIGNCADSCLIQSLNNRKLVLAQFDYQGYAWGELRGASDNAAGSWERFRIEGNCSSGCAIRALGWAGDARYVSAELDYTGAGYGMLRARATSVGGWERFIIQ